MDNKELFLITEDDLDTLLLSEEMLAEISDGRGPEEEEERVESIVSVLSVGDTRRKSPLIDFELLSPNFSLRTAKIRRSTPHHVAGKANSQAIAALFDTKARNASTNVAIGFGGDSTLCVSEIDRAWTSSSSINDNLAITFEISNSAGGPDWPISDASIKAWVDFQIDICEFYGYKGVKYVAKPANVVGSAAVEAWIKTWEDPEYLTITLHNWFAATACPGPYFMRELPRLVKEINTFMDVINGPDPEKPEEDAPPAPPVEETPPEDVKDFNPYLIRITATALNVRSGPGTTFGVVMTLQADKNIYTIIEEAAGPGAKSKWGKLKSGIGWISLDYTVKA